MLIGTMRRLWCARRREAGIPRRRMDATHHLLSSPENVRQLQRALDDSRAGKGIRLASVDDLRRLVGL
jgi:hypothetical protein